MIDLATRLHPTDLAWLRWVAGATVSTGILLAAAYALDVLLRRRVEARWRVMLPAIVLVRLALPIEWSSPLGVFGRHAAVAAAPEAVHSAVPVEPTRVAVTTPLATSAPPAPTPALAPMLHAGVALALLGAALGSRWRASSALRDARPARDSVTRLAAGVPVVEHDALGPAVVGLVRPRIVMPSPLVDALAEEEAASVIRHEVAHVRRRDPLLRMLVQLATFAAWPVLPAWLAASWLKGLVEQACDERALEGGGAQARGVHARALVDVATWRPRRLHLALGLLPFGEGVRARVRALRFSRRWTTPAQLACVALLALTLVLTLGARAAEPAAAGGEATHAGGVARVGEGSAVRLRRPTIPPLVSVEVEMYRAPAMSGGGAPLDGGGEAASELLNAAQAAALRARLRSADAESQGSFPLLTPLDGRNVMESMMGPGADGGFEEKLRLIVEPEDDGQEIELNLTTWELPAGRRVKVSGELGAAGDAVHLVRLADSRHGAIHLIASVANVTFTPGAPMRVDSQRLSLDVFQTPLAQAVERLGLVGQMDVDPSVASRPVSIAFDDLPWEEAVARMAEAAGVDWRMRDASVELIAPEAEAAPSDPHVVTGADDATFARLRALIDSERLEVARIVPEPARISVYGKARDQRALAAASKAVFAEFALDEMGVIEPAADGTFEFFLRVQWPIEVQAQVSVARLDASAREAALVPARSAPMPDDPRVTLLLPESPGQELADRLDELASAGRARIHSRPTVIARVGQAVEIATQEGNDASKITLSIVGTHDSLTGTVTLELPWIPGDPVKVRLPSATALLKIAEPGGGVTLVSVDLHAVRGSHE